MDIESTLVPIVQTAFPRGGSGPRVLTDTANDLEQNLPVIKVLHSGGAGDLLRLETFSVECDIYHTSKKAASDLAWSVYHWFMEQMPPALGHVGVRRVDSAMLPVQTSYANPDIWRYTFNVLIHTHDRSF